MVKTSEIVGALWKILIAQGGKEERKGMRWKAFERALAKTARCSRARILVEIPLLLSGPPTGESFREEK